MENKSQLHGCLLIEDRSIKKKTRELLARRSFEVVEVGNVADLWNNLGQTDFHLLIAEDEIVGEVGQFLRRVRKASVFTQVILFGNILGPTRALNWINAGGFGYFNMPPDFRLLEAKIHGLAQYFHNQNFLLQTHRSLTRKLRQHTEEVSAEVKKDELTGLAAKKYFYSEAERLLQLHKARKLPLSLLVFDIDNFKVFNDTHGHAAGDRLLAELGSTVANLFRKGDLVGRVGGEEFSVVLSRADNLIARKAGERLRKQVEKQRFDGEERQPSGRLTVSVGSATSPEHGETVSELFETADRAMYYSKEKGRNRFTETVLHRFKLVGEKFAQANSVELTGDFVNWEPLTSLEQSSPGAWEAEVPVPGGELLYGFLVDGDELVPDPGAKSVRLDDGRLVSRVKTG